MTVPLDRPVPTKAAANIVTPLDPWLLSAAGLSIDMSPIVRPSASLKTCVVSGKFYLRLRPQTIDTACNATPLIALQGRPRLQIGKEDTASSCRSFAAFSTFSVTSRLQTPAILAVRLATRVGSLK